MAAIATVSFLAALSTITSALPVMDQQQQPDSLIATQQPDAATAAVDASAPSLLGAGAGDLQDTPAIAQSALDYYSGPIQFVNNVQNACAGEAASITYFYSVDAYNFAQADLPYNSAAPASSPVLQLGQWYTMGVQENVYMECKYKGNSTDNFHCAYPNSPNGFGVDQMCYQFHVDPACTTVTKIDCPFPGANTAQGYNYSPAPDGSTRYSISAGMSNGVCVITATSLPNPAGPIYCSPPQ